jgi:hypothetical protein
MATDYKATTLPEFVLRLEEIRNAWKTKAEGEPRLWFRGHKKSSWPLVPKLYRPNESVKQLLIDEDEIREEFVRRAPSLTSYRPANAWEWYFLMQHYGAPTRLLDWTEDPLIGLLFALLENEGFYDAAVWVLDPWRLNDIVLGRDEVIPPGSDGLPEVDTLRYKLWLPDRFDAKQKLLEELPVAIYPNQFDRRIAAQKSCFTVHGRKTESLESLFRRTKTLLARIIIPGFATSIVRDGLEEYGIDEVSIYPDLVGLGKSVARFLSIDDPIPHDRLYTRLRSSPIHGVGVFAVKNIKKATAIFPGDSDELLWVDSTELPRETSLRKFYEDFAVVKTDAKGNPTRFGCPVHFNRLTMPWYLNDQKTGEKPNVRCDENFEFWALRDIKRGEELTVDSSTYSDHAKTKRKKSASSRTSRKRK